MVANSDAETIFQKLSDHAHLKQRYYECVNAAISAWNLQNATY